LRNAFLDQRTAAAIDTLIAKVLRGLGNPEPPLHLEAVRTLQKLDKQFYSSTDDSAVREFVSRVKVGGKLLIEKPSRILDVIKKFDLKALYVPDYSRILLDKSQPEAKWRWYEAHEIIHSVVPHHQSLMHGDDLYSLNPTCHEKLEDEANYGAGRLLFLQERFEEFVHSSTVNFALVKEAKRVFKNSMTSSLWRTVEALEFPAFGMVSGHPQRAKASAGSEPYKYFLRSRKAMEQFSGITPAAVFASIKTYCSWSTKGPLGESEVRLADDNGNDHDFLFETFHNGYEALTLATYRKASTTMIAQVGSAAVSLVSASRKG